MHKAQTLRPDPAMHGWQAGIDLTQGPPHLAIAEAIGQAIAAGDLRPGDHLPAHRVLAAALGVDLATVARGYAESRRRGYLQANAARGGFAHAGHRAGPAAAERAPLNLSMNLPPLPAAPRLRDLLRAGLDGLYRRAGTAELMTCRLGPGTEAERLAGANWVRPLLGELDPERVVVCPGAQCALTALLTTLIRPGDVVATDRMTYPGMRALANQLGVRLAGVDGDADGMLPDALEKLCRTARPKAVYVLPTIQNPTTTTMPPARRAAVADVAARHGLAVIEDDPHGLLPVPPPVPLAALGGEAVYYVASLSKVLSPGLRIAYVVAPGRAQAARLSAALLAVAFGPAPLLAGLATAWIEDGSAAALAAGVRDEAAARQALAREVLGHVTSGAKLAAHPQGLHAWMHIPAPWRRQELAAHAHRHGLGLVPSDAFLVDGEAPNAVRIALGAAPDRVTLRQGLQALAGALAMGPEPPGAVV